MTTPAAVRVVQLGARCELDASSIENARSHRVQFSVQEFADLSDGRRVPIRYGGSQGFGMELSEAARDADLSAWTALTIETLEADVRTVVLPDIDDGADHPWDALQRAISEGYGLAVAVDELKRVPYVVEFSDDILARITSSTGS